MAHNVPQELIDQFISDAAKDKQSLVSWSLVSRACYLSAFPWLFRTIRIVKQLANYEGLLAFYDFLESKPQVLTVIRRLELHGIRNDSVVPWTFSLIDLVRLLETVPTLEELEIRPLQLFSHTPGWPEALKNRRLKYLCLGLEENAHVMESDAALQFLSLFHTVDTLIFRDSFLVHYNPNIGNIALPGPAIQVKNMILDRPHQPVLQLSRDILRLDKKYLRSLSFTFWGRRQDYDEARHLFNTYGETLRHLEIHFVEQMNFLSQDWDLTPLTRLQTISFSIGFDPTGAARRETIINVLRRFPRNSSVRSITLFFTYKSWKPRDTDSGWYMSIDSLCWAPWFPALETVRLIWVDASSTQGLYTQNAADGTRVPDTRWTEDDKAFICSNMRGIHSQGLLKFQ